MPNTVQIKVGGTVTWKNVDTAAHTVTSGKNAVYDGIFDSSMVMGGSSFNYKFDKTGTYDYFCMVHPWMTGKVTVS
ncbi:MAG: cupredoxin domain-containing protein [Nitrosarchaeum sp.]|nr:cupredoxin domain-containing protein [Nitrosarchaeum sp.]